MMGPVKARGEDRLLQDPAMSALRRAWTPDPDARAVVRGPDEFYTGEFEVAAQSLQVPFSRLGNSSRSFVTLQCC